MGLRARGRPPGTAEVVVVGLGPGGTDLLLPAARRVIEQTPASRRFARTGRHPAVEQLERQGLGFATFDALYQRLDTLDEVYRQIVTALCTTAAERGPVVYAVPGAPDLAEATVHRLREQAGGDPGLHVEVVPGLSFADYAWSRLGIDPLAGARVVDGRVLQTGLPLEGGTLLIAQCDGRLELSDLKVSLLERLDAESPVTVLWHLGLPEERIRTVPLAHLDREVSPDHLTALMVELPGHPAALSWSHLVALVERLRAPGGCPWDAEQTHLSLSRHLLEETYEVLEAIEALPPGAPGGPEPGSPAAYQALAEELGDLVFQVVFHSTLAREVDAFGVEDVVRGIHDKLVRRHPHVFGDVRVDGAEAVLQNWERLKRQEKRRSSLVSDVPRSLPALMLCHKLLRKTAAGGLPWGSREDCADEVAAALAGLRAGESAASSGLGVLLAATVRFAHAVGVDPEAALRQWATGYRERFMRLEALAGERGELVEDLEAGLREQLWKETAIPPS